MADYGLVLGGDALYVEATARELGWRVVGDPGRAVMLSKGAWAVRVRFHPGHGFRDARSCSLRASTVELTLPEVVDTLEHWGSRCAAYEVAADVVNDLLDDLDGGWEDDASYDWSR